MDIVTLAMAKAYTDGKCGEGGYTLLENIIRPSQVEAIKKGSVETGHYFTSLKPNVASSNIIDAVKAMRDGGNPVAVQLHSALPVCFPTSYHDDSASFMFSFQFTESEKKYHANVWATFYTDRLDIYATTTPIG